MIPGDDRAATRTARRGPASALAIRDRTEDDLAGCVAILAEVHRRDGYPMHWPDDPAGWLAKPEFLGAWVATVDGQLVGHAGLSLPAPGDAAPRMFGAPSAMVTRLFVSSTARGQGAGSALIAQAVHAARQHRLHPVLDVHSTNLSAAALYERLGWRLLGTSQAQWGPDRVTVCSYAAPR